MARRKKDDNGSVFLLIFFAILIVLIIATPLVLIGGYFFYKRKLKNEYSSLNGDESDFWLSHVEQGDYIQLAHTLSHAYTAIDDAKLKGRNEGVSQNQDGQFSARSNLGKELRNIIGSNERTIENNKDNYNYLRFLPQSRWEEFSNTVIRTQSFLIGFYSWLTAGIIFIFIYSNSFLSGVETFIKLPVLAMDGALTGGDWKMLLGTTAIAIASYFIKSFLSQGIPKELSPIPSEVTPDNYNKY